MKWQDEHLRLSDRKPEVFQLDGARA